MNIRPATGADAADVARLFAELGYPMSPAEAAARVDRFITRSRGSVLLAEEGGQTLGLAAAEVTYPPHHADPIFHLSALVVSGAARRRGVGGALLAAVEQVAAEAGCTRMVVTSAEPRADAHAFYLAHGWSYTGRRFGKDIESE